MALSDQIQHVRLAGIPLTIQSITTTGGQKTAIHEFVNTSRTSVEDLGEALEQFSIDAIVHGENYIQNLKALKLELSNGGIKQFTHITLGTFSVKVLRGYSIVESQNAFGEARVSIRLQRVTDNAANPVNAAIDENVISTDAQAVKEMSAAAIENQTTVLSGSVSQQALADKLLDFVENVRDQVDKVNVVRSKINDFARTINLIKGNVYSIIQTPLAIGRSIVDVFDAFDDLIDTPSAALKAYKGLFNFGSDDTATPNNTFDYIARQQNLNVVNNAINAIALANAYNRAAEIEFQTVGDIKLEQDILEDQYDYLVNRLDEQASQSILLTRASGTIFRTASVDSVIIDGQALTSASGSAEYDTTEDLMFVLDQIRSDARLFFNEKRLTTPKIIEIDAPVLPAAVISYLVYGSTEFTEDLLELNGATDTIIFGGNGLKVITG